MTTNNPLIDPYDHFKGYNDSIEKLKNNPDYVELDKLCYEVLATNESGKKLLEKLTNDYVIPPLVALEHPHFATMCVYVEGFKAAFRMLRNSVKSHSQRIKAETNI